MAPPPPPTAAKSAPPLPERVLRALREAIQEGEFGDGAVLVQDELAARFGVSRSPVREALRQLEAEGLVTLYPHRGFVVAELTRAEVRELYDMRIPLELSALEHAFPHLAGADLDRAEEALRGLDAARDGRAWGRLDRAFHLALYAPSGRRRLLATLDTWRATVNRYQHAGSGLTGVEAACQREHRAILAALRGGDLEGAQAALRAHLEAAALAVMAVVNPTSGPGR